MKISRRESIKAVVTAAAVEVLPERAWAESPIRLIVLDVGGTIIQDHGDVPDALQAAFWKHGMKVTADEIAVWRGATKREAIRRLAADRSRATGNELDKTVEAIYSDFNARVIEAYRTVPPIDGVEAAF